ncbi:antitoxin [bacterium B13(2017)]|nr:antitoxin [bacterium B13(2017)]
MNHIEIDPKICNGKPIIQGTRIPIKVILDMLADGNSWEEIIEGYPVLKLEDIKAAIQYASATIEHINLELIEA